ncbi:MAG: sigma-70 family RNA polymerase sigma factor [Archangium sp.]|nr:sigma-70 family RNA polymerase sigma factor [Archangium sp.]
MAAWNLEALRRALGSDEALAPRLSTPSRTWGVDEAALVSVLRATGLSSAVWPELDLDGLLLAHACLKGDATALRVLDVELLPPVATALSRRASADEVDEALQVLRARLLVGAEPKLSKYSGRGPLGAFLRIAGSNVLSNLRPAVANVNADDELAAVPDASDLESKLARRDQQQQFRQVFREAVQALTARERSLLRLSLLDGLSIDELAPMYGVHRASVARWLTAAKERLSAITRSKLSVALQLPEADVERLLTSVQNGFELSLSRALRESGNPAPKIG